MPWLEVTDWSGLGSGLVVTGPELLSVQTSPGLHKDCSPIMDCSPVQSAKLTCSPELVLVSVRLFLADGLDQTGL
jgi:hypothetical protein